jgi:hypothetical protein
VQAKIGAADQRSQQPDRQGGAKLDAVVAAPDRRRQVPY